MEPRIGTGRQKLPIPVALANSTSIAAKLTVIPVRAATIEGFVLYGSDADPLII